MEDADFSLLNNYQHGFPLVSRPYRAIAADLGLKEPEVLERLARLCDLGAVRRIGAVFTPGAIGVGCLAAMAVPSRLLADVVCMVNAHEAVNHNYEREHSLNLWFVATAADDRTLNRVFTDIETRSGLAVMRFPLVEPYHIDLGFDLHTGLSEGGSIHRNHPAPIQIDDNEWRMISALETGLPLSPSPFALLARLAGVGEGTLLRRLAEWLKHGDVRRFGVIVGHRVLGYRANAMAVWDVPDRQVGAVGRALATEPGINLCYRRQRVTSQWPFNLYCMIHGRSRDGVNQQLAQISDRLSLTRFPHDVLFTRQCFKQTGARYAYTTAMA